MAQGFGSTKLLLSTRAASPAPTPAPLQATNKHGRRLNPRRRIPMHVMACFALRALPGHEGNLSQIATRIKAHPSFNKELDWSPRPGTKTYPR